MAINEITTPVLSRSFHEKTNTHPEDESLKNAGIELEKIFLKPHFSQILNENEDNTFFGDSYGGKMWKSLFVEEMVNLCAGRLGLSSMIEDSIQKKNNPYQKSLDNAQPQGSFIDA